MQLYSTQEGAGLASGTALRMHHSRQCLQVRKGMGCAHLKWEESLLQGLHVWSQEHSCRHALRQLTIRPRLVARRSQPLQSSSDVLFLLQYLHNNRHL